MSDRVCRVPLSLLKEFACDVFEGVGVPQADAAVCADVLTAADELGIDSHGIGRLKAIYYDRVRRGTQSPVTQSEIVREGPATAVIDGHNGMGQVIADRAMRMAIDKAERFGLGMVAVRNSNHYGIAGYYALMAAARDMIGITGTNARPSIAPTFGVENMLGTNPLTFAMPSDEDFPFLIDCATSITQRGKIEAYDRAGRAVPPGWVIGTDGRTRTDTHAILEDLTRGAAALTPLGGIGEEGGGYKGYGYATVVEILSSALQQGAFLKSLAGVDDAGKHCPHRLGHFFLAVNIAAFTEPAQFRATTGAILRALRQSRKAPGATRIYTAGEKEHLARLERREKGVPVLPPTQREMLQMKRELDLSRYRFEFEE